MNMNSYNPAPMSLHDPIQQEVRPAMSQYPSIMLQNDNPFLNAFRYHVGIHNDPSLCHQPQFSGEKGLSSLLPGKIVSSLTSSKRSSNTTAPMAVLSRPAPNIGIYQRVYANEQTYAKQFKIYSVIINGALGLQIMFAAALTALGAGNGSHKAVTVFGAANTVLAGLLTFLKGSGLPNRLKYYENSWSKVREYIEQRERDIASDVHRGGFGWEEVAAEIAIIEKMYEDVRQDIEANTPESYVGMSNVMKNASSSANTINQSALTRGMSQLNSRLPTVQETTENVRTNVQDRIRSNPPDTDSRVGKNWGDLEKRTTIQVSEVIDGIHDRSVAAGKQAVTSAQQSASDHLNRSQSMASSRLHDAQNSAGSRYQEMERVAASRISDAQHRFEESQHDAEAKFKEMEHKLTSVAENVAGKVLNFTKHRHEEHDV